MSIILNGTTGITTPDVTSDGSLKIDASAPDDSLVVNASGNVGVGTSSPTVYGSYKTLEVRGTGGGLLQFGTGANTAAYIYQDGTNSGFNNIANGVMTFGTNNTERARIDSSGNLLVGKTTTADGAPVGFIARAGGSTTSTIDNPNGNSWHLYNINATNNGYRFYVNSNGGVYNFSGNNVNLSDERTKKNIEVAGGYLDKICAIPVKLFNYKDEAEGEQRTLGVIAQDVEAVAPELVNSTDGWQGTEPEDGVPLKTIYTTDMMFGMMKAIQELKAINDAQTQTIESLTARVVALEGQP